MKGVALLLSRIERRSAIQYLLAALALVIIVACSEQIQEEPTLVSHVYAEDEATAVVHTWLATSYGPLCLSNLALQNWSEARLEDGVWEVSVSKKESEDTPTLSVTGTWRVYEQTGSILTVFPPAYWDALEMYCF